jgi:hypothetical protein
MERNGYRHKTFSRGDCGVRAVIPDFSPSGKRLRCAVDNVLGLAIGGAEPVNRTRDCPYN